MLGELPSQQDRKILTLWTGPLLIALVSIIMLWWTWGTWNDALIDFGAQLYMAWQIADGHTPYSEIAGTYKGPLSAHLNALWFQIFGVSLQTLVILNLLILAGVICLFYRLLAEIGDHLSATVACLILASLFAFSQYGGIGNYNFVCPYSHEVTHGLVLSLVAISCLSAYLKSGCWPWLVGIGISSGLTFLTDPHIFAAGMIAVLAGLGLTVYLKRPRWYRLAALSGIISCAATFPPLFAFLVFYNSMNADDALRSTLGSWPWILSHNIANHTFYRWSMGTINAATNVKLMLHWTVGYTVVFALGTGLSMLRVKSRMYRLGFLIGLFLALSVLLTWLPINWLEVARPLPLILLGLGILWSILFLGSYRKSRESERIIVRLSLIGFALALLGKIILYARFYHYGFVLAMPAALIVVVALLNWIPLALTKQGGDGWIFRVIVLAVLFAIVAGHLQATNFWLSRKIYGVGTGGDHFLADARGLYVNKALEEITRSIGLNDTLAVIPEGAMINYLARKKNPTPHINLVPLAFLLQGEAHILDSFRTHPPDYVALVHKDTSEEGFRFFGRDYGQQLFAWIVNNYHELQLIGDLPLQSERFGILLLRRNATQ
jgi:hypothetical protein